MKKTFRAMIVLLLTATLCTSCKAPDKKESSDEKEKTEELEINEDEYNVDLEEGEGGGGF